MCRQLQRGVQALHEDRTKLQRTLESTEKRVGQLEAALSSNNSQVAMVHNLVMALVSNDQDCVAAILRQQGGAGVPRGGGEPDTVGHMGAFPGNAAVREAEDHQRKENARSGGMGVMRGPMPGSQSMHAQQYVVRHEGCVGATASGVEPMQLEPMQLDRKGPPLLNGAGPDKTVAQENHAAPTPTVGSDLPGQPGLGTMRPYFSCCLVLTGTCQ